MIRQTNLVLKLDQIDYNVKVDQTDYSVSLSRTGAQGSRGHSVTGVTINDDGDLIVEVSDSLGNVINNLNAGNLSNLVGMESVAHLDGLTDGDIIVYNQLESRWKNHKLTTTSISDIDNTNKEDGAVLLYSSNSSKYVATKTISNENTIISGGSF